jgi:hypothetical protein
MDRRRRPWIAVDHVSRHGLPGLPVRDAVVEPNRTVIVDTVSLSLARQLYCLTAILLFHRSGAMLEFLMPRVARRVLDLLQSSEHLRMAVCSQ